MIARAERVAPGPASSFVWKRRRDPRFEFSWHFHPEVELTRVVRSRGRRLVGDSVEDYADGDLVLLGPELPHTWHSEPGRRGPHEAVVVQFAPAFLGPAFLAVPELLPVRRLLERARRGLRFEGRPAREVGRRLDAMQDLDGFARLRSLLEVLALLAAERRARPLASPGYAPPARRGDPARIDRVCRFLAERFLEDVPLAEAASRAHLSPSAFCRFFRARTGKTLVGYLNELRIGHACRLLVETDRPVADVAFASGFHNLAHFNRRFLALRGRPPREFRRAFSPP
jgi:AraC-like DNA-binding protein